MQTHICNECKTAFTSREKYESGDADVVEETTCDIVEGDYIEWTQVRCPKCNEVVEEYGR